ncbi:MAG: anaerobic ribonucleoside-triphosphate reductase activating protein [Saccharofermentanales bacterium]|jgi:anaerobic ribonucleoside-triphosphate reductase activating protein
MIVKNTPFKHETGEILQLAGLEKHSVVDGPGIRMAIFAQGCPHRCPGCHNPETHLTIGGEYRTVEELILYYEESHLLRGVTLSGGEPFMQAKAFACLADAIRKRGGDIITYTGYYYEDLERMNNPDINALLSFTDLLIDGPFIKKLKTLTLPFRGSGNQRLISLSETGQELCRIIESAQEVRL